MFSTPAIITGEHEVRDFDCGHAALNAFLVDFALFVPAPTNPFHLLLLLKDVIKTTNAK